MSEISGHGVSGGRQKFLTQKNKIFKLTLFFLKATFPSRDLTTFFANTEQILTIFDFGWENPGGGKPTKNVAIKKKASVGTKPCEI